MRKTGYVILFFLLLGLMLTAGAAGTKTYQKKPRKRQAKTEDNRVYLIHADTLHYDQWRNNNATILNGHVQFMHKGSVLDCDSAYFYEATNSFEAFSHVRMRQGDTLSLASDYAFYDGNDQMAMARRNVVLKHRKSTLYTDSLNYDRMYGEAYFFEGGKLVDNGTLLTSDWGTYFTASKEAVFYYDVELKGKDFYLTGDTLYYDTKTSVAHAVGPSRITSGGSVIDTDDGYYNTQMESSVLVGRSEMRNGDKFLSGDSVLYDSKSGQSYAYGNVVYIDTLNKNKLTGDYGEYNEQTGYAMSTGRAVAYDFSQGPDTLYVHADTFKIFTININTDSVYRTIHAYNKVRAYRTDVQAVCDSLVYITRDSCMTMYHDPILWNSGQQVLGEVIRMYMKDSVINRVHVDKEALTLQLLHDSIHYNQMQCEELWCFFKDGDINEMLADKQVTAIYFPIDEADSSLIVHSYIETSQMKMFFENRKMVKMWTPSAKGNAYPLGQIPPDRRLIDRFAWFDYIRPTDKDDIFNWRGKKEKGNLNRKSH